MYTYYILYVSYCVIHCCHLSTVTERVRAKLQQSLEEASERARARDPKSASMQECKSIAELLANGTSESLDPSNHQGLLDRHPSLRKGLTGLFELLEKKTETETQGCSLMSLLKEGRLSVYVGETRQKLHSECFRWIRQEGSYNGFRYKPNVTKRDSNCTTLPLDEIKGTYGFEAVELVSVRSRNESRIIEGMLQKLIQDECTGSQHDHKTWLWKWLSQGKYEHKYDYMYECFSVFVTIAPSLHNALRDDGPLRFNNNRPAPRRGETTLQ